MKNRAIVTLLCLLLTGSLLCNLAGCAGKVQAPDLMRDVTPGTVAGRPADDAFVNGAAGFGVRLFQHTAGEENVLLSPLSAMLTLAMIGNGAAGQTKAEMETVLGGLPIEDLNAYLSAYVGGLPSDDRAKLNIANSIWMRDRIAGEVEPAFLQTNADYYGASVFNTPFNKQTVKDMNGWVKEKTDGMIDQIVKEFQPDDILYLINALAFDAKWEEPYTKESVKPDIFTAADGTLRDVKMMYASENRYLDDGRATGFVKDYKGGRYSFAALLPNEGVPIGDYIASLTGAGLLETLREAGAGDVRTYLPAFTYQAAKSLKEPLAAMGMPTAFDTASARLPGLGGDKPGDVFISALQQKTFIEVDEKGTRAAAATWGAPGASAPEEPRVVRLDRPFVYLILDRQTNLPVFIGAVMDIEE